MIRPERQSETSSATSSTGSERLCIRNEGLIKHIALPAGWRLRNCFSAEGRFSLKTYGPEAIDHVEMRVSSRGQPLNAHQRGLLRSSLTALCQSQGRSLAHTEIVALRDVMGPMVGNNQYTNLNPRESRCAPACHLIAARVEEWNGKAILAVDGIVVERDGKAGHRFLNFYLAGAETGELHEIMLQAPLSQFDGLAAELKSCLRRIQWRCT